MTALQFLPVFERVLDFDGLTGVFYVKENLEGSGRTHALEFKNYP